MVHTRAPLSCSRSEPFASRSIYENGTGVERNIDQSKRLYRQAASNPDKETAEFAKNYLARMESSPVSSEAENSPGSSAVGSQETSTSSEQDSDRSAKLIVGGLVLGALWLLSGSDSSSADDTLPEADPSWPRKPGPREGVGISGNPCYPQGSFGCCSLAATNEALPQTDELQQDARSAAACRRLLDVLLGCRSLFRVAMDARTVGSRSIAATVKRRSTSPFGRSHVKAAPLRAPSRMWNTS